MVPAELLTTDKVSVGMNPFLLGHLRSVKDNSAFWRAIHQSANGGCFCDAQNITKALKLVHKLVPSQEVKAGLDELMSL